MKKETQRRPDAPEVTPNIASVASAGECTGLMPTPPLDPAEQASYEELFSLGIPPQEEEPRPEPRTAPGRAAGERRAPPR